MMARKDTLSRAATGAGDGQSPRLDKAEPAPNETVVCVLGRLRIEDEKISVGVLTGKETIIQLSKPAKLGNALTVGSWLNDAWATRVDALLVKRDFDAKGKIGSQSSVKKDQVIKHLKDDLGYPDQVTNLLAELFLAPIYITDLYIRSWKEGEVDKSAFKFGMAIKFANEQNKDGLTLFGDIKLEDVALGIISAPEKYKFQATELTLPDLRLIDVAQAEKEAAEADGKDVPQLEKEAAEADGKPKGAGEQAAETGGGSRGAVNSPASPPPG
jgi:hypothetical protein